MDKLIQNFSIKSVTDFFKSKIAAFSPNSENLDYIIEGNDFINFSNLQKVGEVAFNNSDELIVFTCKFNGLLSERSSKKRQFEIAKKVLKEDFKDGAIFIFYDENNCFRFSFIRKNYGNKEQKFTNWKRYTYFVDPSKTNKTFKNRINGCNFSSLEDIQEAFSVEKLNKKFYEEIATAFYSLIGGKVNINKKEQSFDACLKLPSTPVENRKVYQEFAVRLIGRTIFCWFLKNKKSDSGIPLIPEEWLSSNMVASVNNDQHNYYHAILEKLFFLVLNKKVEDRKPYVLPNKHELVPFLNGGLFEAQDDDFFAKDSKGIHQINFALNIPNDWFLKFFETLEQYNFTIDENSINDFEVSIDPEMLGTIFENLLAEIDPDTEKSARKSTGSFYTPREIVDYMVEQSLLQYIKTKTNIEDEEQLEILLKDDAENPFNNKQTVAILEALSEVKILDPACGSGAFPMGVLHKIIALLKKLDKGAVWWKAKQVEKAAKVLDSKYLNDFKEKIENSNSDYARKLGVIQHSIYGVDIQPIAAEISKLRSFLSLIIDENIDDKADNRGIEPLPNLEFKFVTANTLIGLDEGKKEGMMAFDFGETTDLQNQLQQLRNTYLQASPQEKENLKQQFEKLQTQIYKNELKAGGQNKRAQQLAAWKPFSNESSAWFDPDWMFGVEKFDVVIGNPPYGSIIKTGKEYFNNNYKCVEGKHEIYKYFIEKGLSFLNTNGINSYIVPDTWTGLGYFKKLRKLIFEKYNLVSISKTLYKVFEMAMVDTNIFFIQNKKNTNDEYFLVSGDLIEKEKRLLELNDEFVLNIKENNSVIKKIDIVISTLDDFTEIWQGLIAYGKKNQPRSFSSENKETEFHRKLLYGKNVSKYFIEWGGEYLKYGEWLHRPRPSYIFDNEKILVQRIRNPQLKQRLVCAFDDQKFINGTGMSNILLKENVKDLSLKYILAILNSKLINYWFSYYFNDVNIKPEQLRKIPIVKCSTSVQKIFENLISEIDLLIVNKLEINETANQIDLMVYKLYELSYAEVLVVDPEFGLSEEEYNSYVY
ncbi:Eco57I restriction-modification methylase domain-containing protein [Flavobacterium celericrescens]|uniref:site-specific DNA-methyltransferase (adenine-specific) n=1 Tax=Flavobacterium celericrescens TaxID=2709780 RepID=A0ABX0I940_9FLAO|nr:TaqI-like C-terminal specificity domain-containing protein [Flavobacterium celericrescens]NHM03693.1 N-6 DNA methylase [Flavobacterium celericrescens]